MEPLPRFFPIERVIAFSDGVFAVVITILVLGIELPADLSLDPASIAAEREKLLHQLLVYVVAFWLIALYWVQHSLLFSGLRRLDRGLVVLNLLFLLPVSLLPFVTQLMGARRDDWTVVLVFALTNLVAAGMLQRQWKHVLAVPETHAGSETKKLAGRLVWGSWFFTFILILGVFVSLFNVKAGTAVILLVPFVFFINFLRVRKSSVPGTTPDDDSKAT